ncbi:MAG: hypothetical protein HND55_11315 [Pseudomonadota bacterium]|nr:MAG: hypothetical protein HND55_11315 [Pseudomonadota bacterium]
MSTSNVRWVVPVLLGTLILLFPAGTLRALGLGEARVDSWLGQRLDVSIRLIEAEGEAGDSLTVGVASLEDFERLGVPSESLALGLGVSVDRNVDPPRVRIRSQQVVSDPIVQVLIDARWSNGRVLREYTLFLDPPTIDSPPPVQRRPAVEPEAATPPPPRPARTEPADRRPAATPTPAEPASAPAPSARQGAGSVTVARGDTLWRIANDWRPDRSLSMDQVMLAIFNRNRQAFIDDNINRLRSEVRLDMPDVADVRAISDSRAEQTIREHMRAWQQGTAEPVPVISEAGLPEAPADQVADPAPAAVEPESVPEPEPESEVVHRLDVVPPEEDDFADGSAVSDGDIERVEQAITQIEDELLLEDLGGEEFDQRIAEIRDALRARDMAGLAVAEESLAELEQRLREERERREAQAAREEVVESTDSVSDYLRELEQELAAEEAATDVGSDSSEAPVSDAEMADSQTGGEQSADASEGSDQTSPTQATEPMPVTRSPGGGFGWLWPAVGVLVVVVAIALLVLWLRRRGGGAGDTAEDNRQWLEEIRAEVASNPSDLTAHLMLLRALADHGDEAAFADAFDRMYQQVDDESAGEWQEALSLAAAHAPDHPLLTPREERPVEAGDELERRADELMGMFDEEEAGTATGADDFELDEGSEPDESVFDEIEVDEASEDQAVTLPGEDDEADENKSALGEDMDLAVLAERLDDPSQEPGQDTSFDEAGTEADFDEFDEIEELPSTRSDDDQGGPDEAVSEGVESTGESAGMDLDFEFSSQVEADDNSTDKTVIDETETPSPEVYEDLDLPEEDAGDADSEVPPGHGEEPVPGAEAAGDEPPDDQREGATLSDEDADVKLDLARAYISVDLADSARTVLEEVASGGSSEKQAQARKLLDEL